MTKPNAQLTQEQILRNRIYRKNWRQANPDKIAEHRRRYKLRHPDKIRDAKKAWAHDYPEYIIKHRVLSFKRRARKLDPAYRRKLCRQLTTNMLQIGMITRPDTCEYCGKTVPFEWIGSKGDVLVCTQLQAHHLVNYVDPYKHRWLCTKCHIAEHRRLRKRKGIKISHSHKKPMTAEDIATALQLKAEGLPQTQIGKMLGRNNSTISKLFSRMNLK